MKKISRNLALPYHKVVKLVKQSKNQSVDEIYGEEFQCTPNFNHNDFEDFLAIIDENEDRNLAGEDIFRLTTERNCKFGLISYSTFYRKFLQNKKISYKTRKLKQKSKKDHIRLEKRRVTAAILYKLLANHEKMFYFDECSFQMSKLGRKFWGFKGEKHYHKVWNPLEFVKIMMIVGFEGIVSFQLSFSSSNGKEIKDFLVTTLKHLSANLENDSTNIILLDNATKNRIKGIKSIVDHLPFRIFYTVPITPEHNLIENVFLRLKRKVKDQVITSRYVNKYSNRDELVYYILKSIKQFSKLDIQAA